MISQKTLELLNKNKIIIICVIILLFISCFNKQKEITEFFLNILVGEKNY